METNSIQSETEALLQPTACRYIKLGPAGAWLDRCLADGLVELGHGSIPHSMAAAGEWDAARQIYQEQGSSPAKATDFVREVRDFYTQPVTTLWITIGNGRLWWAFADEAVEAVADPARGARSRRVIGNWRSTNLSGRPLELAGLSTRLTKVAAYRQTLCGVEASD